MAEEVKRPRWEDEGLATQGASDKIVCKTCMFRFIEIDGVKVERPDAGGCEIFEYPETKPHDVYFEGSACEYYEKERIISSASPTSSCQ